MLVIKIFLVTIIFLANFAASREKTYSRLLRSLRSINDDRSHVKERQDYPEYFEQCNFVNVRKEQIGYVNVLAFIDPSWIYSFRQTVMLEHLSARLRKSNFPDILFFVIAPPTDLTEDRLKIEIEIQAWNLISTFQSENLANMDFTKENESEIIFVQDNSQSRLWEKFRASKNQVVIIDRCGKLTYQVIVPWSILYFPYVKAAILSTYLEDPCGVCDPNTLNKASNHDEYFTNLTNGADKQESDKNDVDVDVNSIWTTEKDFLEMNATIHLNESLENIQETSTVSSIYIDKITDITTNFNLSNPIESSMRSESAYRLNDTSEFFFNDGNPSTEETRRSEKESIESENHTVLDILKVTSNNATNEDNNTTFLESQQEIFPTAKQSTYTQISTNNSNNASYEGMMNNRNSLNELAKEEAESDLLSTMDTKDQNTAKTEYFEKNTSSLETEIISLPLRIIMRAPHVHRNRKNMKKYSHLILKIGSSDYHEHLEPETDVASSKNLWPDADLQTTNSEEYNRDVTELDANKKNTNQKYVFDIDESPALYEDYSLRNSEEIDMTYRNKTLNNKYNSTDTVRIGSDRIGSDKTNISDKINTNDQINGQEMPNKLIEHYSKLIPWISYILNK